MSTSVEFIIYSILLALIIYFSIQLVKTWKQIILTDAALRIETTMTIVMTKEIPSVGRIVKVYVDKQTSKYYFVYCNGASVSNAYSVINIKRCDIAPPREFEIFSFFNYKKFFDE